MPTVEPLLFARSQREYKQVFAPEFDPSNVVKAIIISTTILNHHFLTKHLYDKFPGVVFIERDLSADSEDEADIIVSANRCIIFFTLAQITQFPPCKASDRILSIVTKYRQTDLLVICSGSVRGQDVAMFTGWIEKIKEDHGVRIIFVNGEAEIKHWTAWLCLWRQIDGDMKATEYLNEEETQAISPKPDISIS